MVGELRAGDGVARLGVWGCGLLVLGSPATFVLGRTLAAVWPARPPVVLSVSWVVVVVGAMAAGWLWRSQLRELVVVGRLDWVQWVLLVVFIAVVTGPRFVGLDTGLPVAVYDDHWHLQKMASVMGSFPDLRHFLFPDLRLSYYFYAYLAPSACHALAPLVPLRVCWAVFVGVTAACVWLFMIVVLNPQLGRSRAARRGFALGLTLLGGLHEWPWLIRTVAAGSGEMHSEWWARSIGVDAQISSPFSTAFWAPQHALGLAIFVVVYRLIRNRPEATVRTGLLAGALLGVLAGFSVYVGLSAALYVALWGCQLLRRSPGHGLAVLAATAAGFGAAVAPILGYLVGRSGNIGLVFDLGTVAVWPIFLVVELGVLLPLFITYLVNDRGLDASVDRWRDGVFVAVLLLMPIVLRSEGINVISYRALLPAQLVLILLAAAAVDVTKGWPGWCRRSMAGVAVVQAAAFIPEATAMTWLQLDARHRSRLPDSILRINADSPLDEVVKIPFQPGVSTRELSANVLHIYRIKDLDRTWYCAGLVEDNHLVYLNEDDLAALDRGCLGATGRAGDQPLIDSSGR